LTFVFAFGAAKAITNLAAGGLAEQVGRKRLLVVGWLVALPIPLLIGLAPGWGFIVAANLLLGVNQGLAWSMTVVMKIDLAGPAGRGPAVHRLAQRPHRPKAADHARHAHPGRRARAARRRRGCVLAVPGRRSIARRRHRHGLSDADRRGVRRHPATRPRPRGRRLS